MNSVDPTAGTVNVQDLLTKKAVVVKVTPESQLHMLPPEFAQRIAMRLKGSMPPGTPGAGAVRTSGNSSSESGTPEAMKPGSKLRAMHPRAMVEQCPEVCVLLAETFNR